MNDQNTQGRDAVIDGASSGIGEATAALAAKAYRVALLARQHLTVNETLLRPTGQPCSRRTVRDVDPGHRRSPWDGAEEHH